MPDNKLLPTWGDVLLYLFCWVGGLFLVQVGMALLCLSPYACTWCKVPSLGLFLLAKLLGVFTLLMALVSFYCPFGMYQQKYLE